MTDARRRELERLPDDESEARALVEAVRAGELTQADLDLAADLGATPAASLATGRPARPLVDVCRRLEAGPRRLAAASALADLVFPAWAQAFAPDAPRPGEWVRDAVEALRAGAPVDPERGEEAQEAALEDDADLCTLTSLSAQTVALAVQAATGDAERALLTAVRIASGLCGPVAARAALARALLPARLAPEAPTAEAGDEVERLRRRLAEDPSFRPRLELAHGLGHAGAGAALGIAPEEPIRLRWLQRLDDGPFTREVAVRALLALGRGGGERLPEALKAPAVVAALRTTIAWCRAPGDVAAAEARRAGQALDAHPVRDLFLRRVLGGGGGSPDLIQRAALACADTPRAALDALLEGARGSPADELAEQLRAHLVPWLLGYRDLLAELADDLP